MSDTQENTERFIGKVKWFNNKSGFGFITVSSAGDFAGKDIFAHYSAILVDNQYKYLVQGEYVEFEITSTTNGEHEHQATKITGILGGDSMCETRRINRPPDDKPRRREDDNNRADTEAEAEDEGFTPVPKKKAARPDRSSSGPTPVRSTSVSVSASASTSDKKRAPRRAKPA